MNGSSYKDSVAFNRAGSAITQLNLCYVKTCQASTEVFIPSRVQVQRRRTYTTFPPSIYLPLNNPSISLSLSLPIALRPSHHHETPLKVLKFGGHGVGICAY